MDIHIAVPAFYAFHTMILLSEKSITQSSARVILLAWFRPFCIKSWKGNEEERSDAVLRLGRWQQNLGLRGISCVIFFLIFIHLLWFLFLWYFFFFSHLNIEISWIRFPSSSNQNPKGRWNYLQYCLSSMCLALRELLSLIFIRQHIFLYPTNWKRTRCVILIALVCDGRKVLYSMICSLFVWLMLASARLGCLSDSYSFWPK